ncbi:MAG: TraR/DksA C4-type zinc finger protein [Planctomycetes bacterium]|nr:TraR/DksA C4-type zinc finger protein [Planctomycetota bacterium]
MSKRFDAHEVRRYESLLLALRHELARDVDQVERDLEHDPRDVLDRGDAASGEATHSREREILRRDAERALAIDEALARLTDGTFGACATCGGDIPRTRLDALPDTRECVACAAASEST